MTVGWILGMLVVVAILIGGAGLGWWVVLRPLDAWVWGTRRALVKAGLKKVIVESPAGPQTVFVGGSGPLLVLLHGAGDQAGTWVHVAPSLAKNHSLIIPDLAGHGDSAPATGPIHTADVFAGLEAVLSSQAQGRGMTLVGNSLGAWMAMVLATRHPDWVERVVAVNGGPLKGSNPDVSLLPSSREEARKTMAQLRDPASPALPDKVLDNLVRRTRTGALARFAATAASMEDWVLSEAQLRSLQMPVRLIWGVSDGLMPMDYAQRMVAVLPDVQLVPIERCGHVPQQEAPERFMAALRQVMEVAAEPVVQS